MQSPAAGPNSSQPPASASACPTSSPAAPSPSAGQVVDTLAPPVLWSSGRKCRAASTPHGPSFRLTFSPAPACTRQLPIKPERFRLPVPTQVLLAGETHRYTAQLGERRVQVLSVDAGAPPAHGVVEQAFLQLTNLAEAVVLIEGYYGSFTHLLAPDMRLAADEASHLGLHTYNPIVTLYDPEVIELFLRSNCGASWRPEEVYAHMALHMEEQMQCPLDMAVRYLEQDMAAMLHPIVKISLAQEQGDAITRRRAEMLPPLLVRTSLLLSAQLTETILGAYSSSAESLLVIHAAHRPMLDVDVATLPAAARLSREELLKIPLRRQKRIRALCNAPSYLLPHASSP